MRAGARAFGLLLGAALAATSAGLGVAERAAEVVATIEVNSSADSPGICPSSAECTLRAAFDAANLSEADVVRIAFSPASFPISAPTTIRLQEAPLPPVSRPDVRIDAGGLPVVLDGSDLLASLAVDGLVLQGPRAALAGLTVIGFSGACIVLAGEGSRAGGTTREEANSAGSCQTGVTHFLAPGSQSPPILTDVTAIVGTHAGPGAVGAAIVQARP